MLSRLLAGAAGAFLSASAFAQQPPHLPPITPEEAKCISSCVQGDRYCGAPNGTSARFCGSRKTECITKCKAPV